MSDYTAKIDELLKSAVALKFTARDFTELAVAAADQAGLDKDSQQELRDKLTCQWCEWRCTMSWSVAYREDAPCPDDECKYRPEVTEAPVGLYKDDVIICMNCGWSIAQVNARAKEAK